MIYGRMTRTDFYRMVSRSSEIKKDDTRKVIDALEEIIIDQLSQGEEVPLFGGFTIVPVWNDEHNIMCGFNGKKEQYKVPGQYSIKLRISKGFKERVNADA